MEVTKIQSIRVIETDEPAILFFIRSGSVGMYHVIRDMPGPLVEHEFLTKFEVQEKYNIVL